MKIFYIVDHQAQVLVKVAAKDESTALRKWINQIQKDNEWPLLKGVDLDYAASDFEGEVYSEDDLTVL